MPALSYITFTDNFINGVEINGNRQWQTDTWDNTTVIYVLRGDLNIPAAQMVGLALGVAR